MWAFNQPLGRADWAFILGWRQRPECFNGRASSLGLASGPASPFFKPYQMLNIAIDDVEGFCCLSLLYFIFFVFPCTFLFFFLL